MQEQKIYFRGTHKLYGFRVEFSVLPNGSELNRAKQYSRYMADLDIFRSKNNFIGLCCRKPMTKRSFLMLCHFVGLF